MLEQFFFSLWKVELLPSSNELCKLSNNDLQTLLSPRVVSGWLDLCL